MACWKRRLPRTAASLATRAIPPRLQSRLNRDHAKVARDPNWPAVEAILWFPIYGASHELIHWLARPLPKLGESKFVAPTGSNGTLWIPPETYAVARARERAARHYRGADKRNGSQPGRRASGCTRGRLDGDG